MRYLLLLVLIGCSRPDADATPVAAKPAGDPWAAPAAPPAPKPTTPTDPGDVQRAIWNGSVPMIDKLEQLAADERKARAAQTAKLDQAIQDVEALVESGQLDRAEIEASDIHWQPDPTRSQISRTDAALIKQYDERRETLLRVIHRKLGTK